MHPFTQGFDQLPASIPIFPLSGAVVLPGGYLPLNIFEPRYLSMVSDAMRNDQLIGMIQPLTRGGQSELYSVGCVGRICKYEEVSGGRLEITLRGLCRFKVVQELEGLNGYRRVRPDWAPYESDFFAEPPASKFDETLVASLKQFFEVNGLQSDWKVLSGLSTKELANNLFGYLPLDPSDKQLLIEATSVEERVKSFIAILNKAHTDNDSTRH